MTIFASQQSTEKMKKILVIDNYDSFVYNLVQILKEYTSCKFDIVRNDMIPFDRLSNYDKILLSPGPGIPEEAGQLMELIDRCHNSHSILGVCLGHQALGQYFGAKLIQVPHPWHGHKSEIKITDIEDKLYKDLPRSIAVGRYHSWLLSNDKFPQCIKITSTDEDGNIMSFSHKMLPVYGVQYHPESIITEYGKNIIRNWAED